MASCTTCSWAVELEDTFCAHCGAPVTDPLIGTVVCERSRIGSRLPVGGLGAVYRDLKPDNIMRVERDGHHDVVKLLDFGIAKVTEPLSGQQALTQAGVIFGTPEYLSPEQALGEMVDGRADLYAAGVILYEMLVGRRPFESDDKVRIISMHLAHAPPRMRDVNPTVDVPPPLEQAVLQALEKHREYRFASATAFLQALDDAEATGDVGAQVAEGATIPNQSGAAGTMSLWAGASGLLRQRRWRRGLGAAAVAVALVVTLAIAPKPRHPSGPARGGAPAPAHAAAPPPSPLSPPTPAPAPPQRPN